ncbi:MAG: class I SAM-dependent methyltransferase [Thermoguttaceae bacterium]
MRRKLRETFFQGFSDEFLASPDGQVHVRLQLYERMLDTETYTIPWIEAGFPLSDATVLEIGCGSGNSTVPIARRARRVIAWDINDLALEVARARAEFFGLGNVEFRPALPGDWIASATRHIQGVKFDFVYLHAVMEHLTIGERIMLLAALWQALPVGGAIGIYETPNRLNFFDWHSSCEPFMDWLPPKLACLYWGKKHYEHFSDNLPFAVEDLSQYNVENEAALYRHGRGVSYHEFDLAIGLDKFKVVADFSTTIERDLSHKRNDYTDVLASILAKANVPRGFASPSLDLVLQKT